MRADVADKRWISGVLVRIVVAISRRLHLPEPGDWGHGQQLPSHQTEDGRAGGEYPRGRAAASERRRARRQGQSS